AKPASSSRSRSAPVSWYRPVSRSSGRPVLGSTGPADSAQSRRNLAAASEADSAPPTCSTTSATDRARAAAAAVSCREMAPWSAPSSNRFSFIDEAHHRSQPAQPTRIQVQPGPPDVQSNVLQRKVNLNPAGLPEDPAGTSRQVRGYQPDGLVRPVQP